MILAEFKPDYVLCVAKIFGLSFHPLRLIKRKMQISKRKAQESDTDLNTVLKKRTADIPLGKLIKPEDIASAVLFFCSPLSKMITGQCIAVDGGSGEAISY